MVAVRLEERLVDRLRANAVTTVDDLYTVNGMVTERIATKHSNFLTPGMISFIGISPFLLIATSHANGDCDVSPKGDPPGAVQVLDSRTLVIPDRAGNRRIDGHRNIVTNPHIGLIFMIPNVDETLRVNGRAFITSDEEYLTTLVMQKKAPKLAMVVEVDEAYMHCARAFLRSGLWKPETWPDPDTVPTLGAIWAEQKDLPPPDESEGKRNEEYRQYLY